MFNGIIKNTGKIKSIYKKNNNCHLEIYTKMKFGKADVGSSISCSGACLTVEKYTNSFIKFYISTYPTLFVLFLPRLFCAVLVFCCL